LTELLALAFFAHPTPVAALRHLLGQLVGGSSYFPVNSLNSFNVWAIFAPFMVSDKTRFLGVSMHVWGTLLFCATAALIYWRYVQSRSRTALFEASALVLLGFFLLLTEMHERYLLYAVLFLGVLLFERPYRFAALLFTLTLLLDLEYGLTFMYLDDARATMINRYEFAPWLIHLCSIANVGVFGALLANYLGLRLPSIARNNLLRATFAPDAAGTRTRSSA
jgi:Gpi18-like mannosyltransferase